MGDIAVIGLIHTLSTTSFLHLLSSSLLVELSPHVFCLTVYFDHSFSSQLGTPEPEFLIADDAFRPQSPEERIALTIPRRPPSSPPSSSFPLPSLPPSSLRHPSLQSSSIPTARVRSRFPHREHGSLQDCVLRTACDSFVRLESKKKYAKCWKADKYKFCICNVFLHSSETKKSHLKAKKHLAKIKKVKDGPQVCNLCNVIVRTREKLENHLAGRSHRKVCKNKYGAVFLNTKASEVLSGLVMESIFSSGIRIEKLREHNFHS